MSGTGGTSLETLFSGRAEAFALFGLVRGFIESLGPVRMDVAKTQVTFARERGFAWIWLPQMWIRRRRTDGITLAFALPDKIIDARIAAAVESYPGRWTHHVVIEQSNDFDDRVREWLVRAYEFGSKTPSDGR